ncbi:8-oxo-dGTP diphosphatase MutT [Glaciecola sp. XM2]|uniref:8-oxo-dGTP diphosphatase MutT n=1 Tax=Glaciecola sp. XM2 TaxID=1914931 RepID=UPI001BDE1AB6|nr:8-oxo-dGTP diphosphatase MutT [Glaciecola sp. XM2]MBT1450521.1 8-oxo-dGTP diphosphatase MutT [Glaciecola sp. XM2]
MKTVNVAVGVVYHDRHFFICRRSAQQHQGNKWEFPGGKVDAGETPEQALKRELKEEIDIITEHSESLVTIEFTYPEKTVCLHVFLVDGFTGTARGAEGQEAIWADAKSLSTYTFPDANVEIIDELRRRGLCQ